MRANFYLFVTVLLLIGCGGSRSQERHTAPLGPNDVGLVADGLTAEQVAQVLKAAPQAQVRTVHPGHGIYEFYNVEQATLEQMTHRPFTRNRFYSWRKKSTPGPEGATVAGLNRCKIAEAGPEAVLTVNGTKRVPEVASTIELGTAVKLSARASLDRLGRALNASLVVIGPGSSGLGEKVFPGFEAEFTPDALGAYRLIAVVQDASDACAMEQHSLIVTANRPFQPGTPEPKIDLRFLQHLRAIDAAGAWEVSEGQGEVIAVIDSGVNYNHPLLAPNIALNSQPGRSGFKDDILGWDFVNSDPFPYDDDGHGTHVAGLAAARQFGLARAAHILPLKAMTSIGGDTASIAAAILYAVDRGARVINLSLGSLEQNPLLERAVAYAEEKDVLLVTAAGNGDFHSGLGYDIDQIPQFPASYPNENILAVAASDPINPLAPYSNFGFNSVDIVAPGGFGQKPLVSTSFENPKGKMMATMSGTSMASPLVAGVAADIRAKAPQLKAAEVARLILQSGDVDERLAKVIHSGRHLNARAALKAVSF